MQSVAWEKNPQTLVRVSNGKMTVAQVPNADHTVFWRAVVHGSLYNLISTSEILCLHHLILHHLNNKNNIQLGHSITYENWWRFPVVYLHGKLLQIRLIISKQNPPLFCFCSTKSKNTLTFIGIITIQNRGEETQRVWFDAFSANINSMPYIFPLITDCFL